jgi:hypothetical protein
MNTTKKNSLLFTGYHLPVVPVPAVPPQRIFAGDGLEVGAWPAVGKWMDITDFFIIINQII